MSSEILTMVGVILLLILASAFFSSAETALTAASDARMRQLAGKGNRRARLVERLRDDREGLIGSILIGNNAVNVIASALEKKADARTSSRITPTIVRIALLIDLPPERRQARPPAPRR